MFKLDAAGYIPNVLLCLNQKRFKLMETQSLKLKLIVVKRIDPNGKRD